MLFFKTMFLENAHCFLVLQVKNAILILLKLILP